MIDVFCIVFGVMAGLVAFTILDAALPRVVRWHKVGGLVHWRFGRIGGTLYRKSNNAR